MLTLGEALERGEPLGRVRVANQDDGAAPRDVAEHAAARRRRGAVADVASVQRGVRGRRLRVERRGGRGNGGARVPDHVERAARKHERPSGDAEREHRRDGHGAAQQERASTRDREPRHAPRRALHQRVGDDRERERERDREHGRGDADAAVGRRPARGTCEDQARPVPQVPRVRDPSEIAQRSGREEGAGAAARRACAGDDHEHRAEDGQERRGTRELRRRAVHDRRSGEHQQPGDPGRRGGDRRDPSQVRGSERDCGACGELPDARRRLEVREGGLRGGLDDGVRERGSTDAGHDDRAPEAHSPRGTALAAELHRGEQEQRPEEVELLLDAQRPVVQHRVLRSAEGEVVDRLEGELPVRVVEGGGERVEANRGAEHRRGEELHAHSDGDQHEGRHREQTPDAAGVERAERDRPGGLELVDEQSRDQEARDHEEDVDPDVPAGDRGHARVERDDEHDRDRPQPLDVRAERPGRCLGDGYRRIPVCPSEYRPGWGHTQSPCGPAPTGILARRRPVVVSIA